ncbi:MAG TPA: HD domain-containing phosphohydrolase [Solirubrobacteraceae bacterium]|nr:HD domain-containing phosphohydrolase [Solirubrobacteraceae bacterium]
MSQGGHARAAHTASLVGLLGGFLWFALTADSRLGDPLFFVLVGITVGAALLTTRVDGTLMVSATFTASMLAVAFLGPAAAFAIVAIAELVEWAVERYRPTALAMNIAVTGIPNLIGATIFPHVSGGDDTTVRFVAVLALIAIGELVLNFVSVSTILALRDGRPVLPALRPPRDLIPPLALNVALIVTLAEVYAQFGLATISFAGLIVVAFSYMARLVAQARERARAYAALSWGVLSGLLRALDERDERAARHGAAVARFSRDIASARGLSPRDQELAHTAGLLHDIGRFALSDRVMERGTTLIDPDWKSIRRHPTIGADLLRDVGLYGPVASIVRAHHERWDGRGYPDGLEGEEIPEIARIVAVAEVYDTLTAPDTYRTAMTSFEALTELRRVAGTQLDPEVVESLATVLAGRDTDYRHAGDADYDRELDILRRIDEASSGSS